MNLTMEGAGRHYKSHRRDRLPFDAGGAGCEARADRIAYINHDIDDALRAGVLKAEDLPREAIRVLGEMTGERINTMVSDIVRTSGDGQGVRMSETVDDASQALRSFMFEYVSHARLGAQRGAQSLAND